VSLRLRFFPGSRLLTLSLLVQLAVSTNDYAWAEKVTTEKWNISADKVIRYENPNSIVAQGNVVLEKNEKVAPRPKKVLNFSSWAELLEEDEKPAESSADQVEKVAVPEFQTTTTIKADWIVYDVEFESIKAKGNVHIDRKSVV